KRVGGDQRLATGIWSECATGRERSRRRAPWRGHDRWGSGEVAHPENSAGDYEQQNASRGDTRHQLKNAAQQAERVRSAAGCNHGRGGIASVETGLAPSPATGAADGDAASRVSTAR